MTTEVQASPNHDRELVLARLIDATPEQVYRAWTTPEAVPMAAKLSAASLFGSADLTWLYVDSFVTRSARAEIAVSFSAFSRLPSMFCFSSSDCALFSSRYCESASSLALTFAVASDSRSLTHSSVLLVCCEIPNKF